MCRVLHQLRHSSDDRVYITPAVRADLKWFNTYFERYNASAIIPQTDITLTIEADASLLGGGAWTSDGRYYSFAFPPNLARGHNICQLEAINYMIALRAFAARLPPGSRIEFHGDNEGAISALSSGKVCDLVLASVARAIWFHAAARQLDVLFTHKPGHLISGADALSRAPTSHVYSRRADEFVVNNGLIPVPVFSSYHNYQKYF